MAVNCLGVYASAELISFAATGICEGQNINYERMNRAYIPLPPLEEQLAIGRFLEWVNGMRPGNTY